jgi:hypothetical protein
VDIVIAVASALVAVVLTLAIAIMRVASRYERAVERLSAPPPDQATAPVPSRRFLRQARVRASSRR